MRLSIHPGSIQVAGVEIHEIFHVTELDAGYFAQPNYGNRTGLNRTASPGSVAFSHHELHVIESQLAIIIPCMNEELSILDGVLHGVPHECLIILVSNSNASNFQAEGKLLSDFCNNAQRSGIVVHQGDEGVAQAFHAAGLPEVVVKAPQPQSEQKQDLRIRNGKGEAMMIGIVIAKLASKQFVGFIDADNFVAGSVHEYCKVYAAGLQYALHHTAPAPESYPAHSTEEQPHAMVRVKWNSKPKVKDDKIVFEPSGRCSRVVNEWMNRLAREIVGDDTRGDIIQTGNAGEHAMSLDLALKLRLATGYAVEPFQLVDAWERFGAGDAEDDQLEHLNTDANEYPHATDSIYPLVDRTDKGGSAQRAPAALNTTNSTASPPRNLQILQIQTRNPHFHDTSKGAEHITRMQVQGLSTIFHSRLASPELKDELRAFMKANFPTIVGADGEPERPRVYAPLATMDFGMFECMLIEYSRTFKVVGKPAGVLV